jgi:pimeloyl-ACP methyl ester carboxylesterase
LSGRPTSSNRRRAPRPSATPSWIHPSPWPPGWSTTTPTPINKIAQPFVDGKPSGNLTRDNILDNITLYWLTGTGASAARSYWEEAQENARAIGQAPTPVPITVGFTTFPGEIWRTPRSWVEKAYPDVVYFNEVDRGGHFGAWEEPELFAAEMRAAFRPVR